jgi:hypothetical protein
MNNNPSWRSEDGQLLRSLREEAGIDELVFARSNTVSLAQLKELELGGNNSFYNPAIKRSTGVKLLKKLGHELVTPELVIVAAEPAAPNVNASPAAMATAMAQVHASPEKPHSDSPRRRPTQQTLFWTLGLCSLVALVAIKPWALMDGPANDRRSDHLAAQNTSNLVTATPGPAQSAPHQREPSPTAVPVKVAALPPPATVDVPKAQFKSAPTTVTTACDWQHRDNSKIHTPSQPLKPGNYVYLEAQSDTELCVIDSQNQKTMLQLKAGMAKSVYGAAPFLVHGQDLQALRLFFQGRRVQETLEDMQYLLLNSQPL